MADPQSTHPPQKLKGIRRTARGWRVYGRVGGTFFSKCFPTDTALTVLKTWRHDRRTTIRARRLSREHDDAPPTLPSVDWRGLTPSVDGWCYVYFIRAGARIKIGRAADLRRRVRELQTAHAEELSLVLSIPAHAALEGAIHQRFAHHRLRGEWFRAGADLVAFIHQIGQGANPVALLFEKPQVPLDEDRLGDEDGTGAGQDDPFSPAL
jgi:hypothetical protein